MKNLSEMPSEPIGEVVASGIDERDGKKYNIIRSSFSEDVQGDVLTERDNLNVERKKENKGIFFANLRHRFRRQKAPEFPDQREVVATPQPRQVQVKMSEGLKPRQVPITEKATGNQFVGEVPNLQPLNHRKKEEEPRAEREKTRTEEAFSRLNDKLESIIFKGVLQAGTEALKASLAKAREKFTPDKLKDFFEAQDVKKHVESSAVFENRESAIRRSVELTHTITEKSTSIANIDSLIAREKAAMSDAEKEKTLRMQLAEGDDQLIQEAQETFDALYQQIQEKIADLESQKTPLVAERDMLMSQKEAAKAVIREDNKRLETLVEGRVENLKAKVGFEQIVEGRDALKEQLKSERDTLSKLDAKIGAYSATIDRGGYSKEKVTDLKAKLKELKAEAKKLRASLDKTEGEYKKIDATTTTLETRFKAMSGVLPKMGVVKESQVKDENQVLDSQTTDQGITASAQTQPQVQQPEPTVLPEYVPGEDYNDPNDLPQDIYEQMLTGQSQAEENHNNQREQLARISKGQFDTLLAQVERNQGRPKNDDINKFIGFARNVMQEKGKPETEINPLIKDLNAIKDDVKERAQKISLLKQIQSKLN